MFVIHVSLNVLFKKGLFLKGLLLTGLFLRDFFLLDSYLLKLSENSFLMVNYSISSFELNLTRVLFPKKAMFFMVWCGVLS